MSYKSRVNQPERVFLNSSDDSANTNTFGFNSFKCTFDTPILGAKRTQLLRATIPNAFPNIVDYQLVFWYYQLPTATTAPSATYLKSVRLYPSTYVPPSGFTQYTQNRNVTGPADLCTLLNAASATTGDSATYNPFWASAVASDVSFAYSSTTNKITMTGLTSGKYYAIAGWDDLIVDAAVAGQTIVQYNFAGTTTVQPLLQSYTMNQRLGYAMSGYQLNSQGNATANSLYANLTNSAFAQNVAIPSDSWPNLVYSQCFYMYANIVSGSSLGSSGQHNLLTVMPNNAAPLAVAQYVAATINWLTKVPDNIYEIEIFIRDDANQPLPLPDNAQVNLELGFWYGEENKM